MTSTKGTLIFQPTHNHNNGRNNCIMQFPGEGVTDSWNGEIIPNCLVIRPFLRMFYANFSGEPPNNGPFGGVIELDVCSWWLSILKVVFCCWAFAQLSDKSSNEGDENYSTQYSINKFSIDKQENGNSMFYWNVLSSSIIHWSLIVKQRMNGE